MSALAQIDVRILLTNGNLSHHLFNMIHLNRALLQNTPDLINQLLDNMLITDALSQILQQITTDLRQTALGFTLGFRRD